MSCSCLGPNRWVCTSNIGAKRGEILVMNSLAMQVSINRSMILQMAQIYRAPINQSSLSVELLPVQQQNGYRDCGLFAIAFATEICRGQNPSKVVFIQTQMWGHFFRCITTGNMMPFPQFPQEEKATLPQQITLLPNLSTIHVTVCCVCRMPDHYDTNMVQCEACKGWYHYSGIQTKAPPLPLMSVHNSQLCSTHSHC